MTLVNHTYRTSARWGFSAALFFNICTVSIVLGQPEKEFNPDDLKRKYYATDAKRVEYQNRTKKYISMDQAYTDCMSRSLDPDACEKTLSDIEQQIGSGLVIFATPIPTQATTVINETNVQVIVPAPISTWGLPTIVRPTPHFETTPRNSFTPKPGFTPQNKYQAGEGLSQ